MWGGWDPKWGTLGSLWDGTPKVGPIGGSNVGWMGAQMGDIGVTGDGTPYGGPMGAQMGDIGVTTGWDRWDPKGGVDGTLNGDIGVTIGQE